MGRVTEERLKEDPEFFSGCKIGNTYLRFADGIEL